MIKEPKPRKCRICKEEYIPYNSLQKVCGVKCAKQLADKENERKARKQAQIERKETRERKEALKNYSQLVQEAEREARKYARLRDIDQPCPSCGRYDHEIPNSFNGGKWDGGHFMGKGAYPELRLHPLNIFRQCKSCNSGHKYRKSKEKSVSEQFEETLRARIGDRMVNYLKGPQQSQNWTREDLRDIRQWYKEQIKLLRSER